MTELRDELLDAVFDRLEESPQWLAKVAAEGGYDWNPALRGAGVGAIAGASIAGLRDLLSSKKPSEDDEEDSHSPMLRALKNMGVGALAGGAIGGAGVAGWNMFQEPANKLLGNISGDTPPPDAPGPAPETQPAGAPSTGATPQAPAPLPQWQGDLSALAGLGTAGAGIGVLTEAINNFRKNRAVSLNAYKQRLEQIADAIAPLPYGQKGRPGSAALDAVKAYSRGLSDKSLPLWRKLLTLGVSDTHGSLANNPEKLINRLTAVARRNLLADVDTVAGKPPSAMALQKSLRRHLGEKSLPLAERLQNARKAVRAFTRERSNVASTRADIRGRRLKGVRKIRRLLRPPIHGIELPSPVLTKGRYLRSGTIGAGIPIGLLLYNMLSRKPVSETLGGSQ